MLRYATWGALAANAIIFITYMNSFLGAREFILKAGVGWTSVHQETYGQWNASLFPNISDPANVTEEVMRALNCTGAPQGIFVKWGTHNASSVCACGLRYVSNQTSPMSRQNVSEAVRACYLQGHATSGKIVYPSGDGSDDIFFTNPYFLVGLWNIISMCGILVIAGIPLAQIPVAAAGLCIFIIQGHGSVLYIGWTCLTVFAAAGVFSLFHIYWKMEDFALRCDRVTWLCILFAFPSTVILYNVMEQRRDILYLLTCFFFSTATVFACVAATLFGRASADVPAVETISRNLGAYYYHVPTYVATVNMAILVFFLQAAYPSPGFCPTRFS